MAIFRNRTVERMRLRKKTRGEADCFVKMRELLKASTEGLENCFNVVQREKKKHITGLFLRLELDNLIKSSHHPKSLK